MKDWNADVGDQRAVEGADRRADRQGEDDGDDPDRRIVEPEIDRQDADLGDANDCRDEAHDRSDREIDVAHDDDEHHPRRHDRDRRCLDAQIPQVARRQEHALATRDQRIEVKPDPDQRQRADHAEHAGVDLGGSEQPSNGRLVRSRAGRARRRRGHAPSRSSTSAAIEAAFSTERPRRLLERRGLLLFHSVQTGSTQLAELHRAGLHAGADLRLGDPALVDDHVEVGPGDRERGREGCR